MALFRDISGPTGEAGLAREITEHAARRATLI
jgi:hypothetical protein